MKISTTTVLATLATALVFPAVASAQDAETAAEAGSMLFKGIAALGAALAVVGGAFGIGLIGKAALESMARQPEAAGPIGTNMIIAAALIEGATLFAVVVGLLALIL